MNSRNGTIALMILVFAIGGALGVYVLTRVSEPKQARDSGSNPLELTTQTEPDPLVSGSELERTANARSGRGESGRSSGLRSGGRVYTSISIRIDVRPPKGEVFENPVHLRFKEIPPLHRKARVGYRKKERPAESPLFEFRQVPPGRYEVLAWSEGFDLAWAQPEFPATDPNPRFSITLFPLASLEGRLICERENHPPLSHVEVHLKRLEKLLDGSLPRLETTTDSAGGYLFPEVPRGLYELVIGPERHPLLPPLRVRVTDQGTRQDIRKVPRAGEAHFQVRDEEGNPLEGVLLTVAPKHTPDGEGGVPRDTKPPKGGGQGETDAEGIFKLGGLPIGRYTLIGRKDGYQNLLMTIEIPADTAPIPFPLVLR